MIGEGDSTMFWKQRWVGDSCLKSRFPHLYRLSIQKNSKVRDMGSWQHGVWCWSFHWRRDLSTRELSQKDDLLVALRDCQLRQGAADLCKWAPEPGGGRTLLSLRIIF